MENAENFFQYISKKKVCLIGVVANEGQDMEGPEMAPEALRRGGLAAVLSQLSWEVDDLGNIEEINATPLLGENAIFSPLIKHPSYKYSSLKNIITIGEICRKLYKITKFIAEKREFSLTLGGDHGLATGSIAGLKEGYPDLKVVWIDAHGDCNVPEESPSGNYHGMPVAHLLGWIPQGTVPGFDWFKPCLKNTDIVYIGLRDLDPAEKKNLKEKNIKCFTMHDITKLGIGKVMEKTFEYLKNGDTLPPIHISFDIDAVDPSVAPGTGTKSRGGLLYREAHFILREIADTGCLVGLDMVEINPLLDMPAEKFHGDNKLVNAGGTVGLGIELIASCLGEKLL